MASSDKPIRLRSERVRRVARKLLGAGATLAIRLRKHVWRHIIKSMPMLFNWFRLRKNRRKSWDGSPRHLEIGPGPKVIAEFERLNIVPDCDVDYVGDARDLSMFHDGEFNVVYASHVLEHIPWYQTLDVLKEWRRVLANDGFLEVWVPDSLKIAQAYVDACLGRNADYKNDGWFRFNEDESPHKWYAGRTYAYGDGSGNTCHPNWHCASFSRDYLRDLMIRAGFREVVDLDSRDIRGYDHGWINMGLKGVK